MKIFLKKCLRKKPQEMKPGAILDAVISQSSATANKCLLYKLADYKRGGDLIDAINTGGLVAVEQLIREQFGVFMYNDGKGQVINRAEFLRWKYRDHTEVTIPIEASLSIHDPLGKWKDHNACWQMQYRGALGESLMHVLIICDSKIHTKLARILLRVFPRLALDVMEGEEYLGASALHLAIAYSNNELVADLIEAGADINQRAIGSFFLPKDQQRANPAKNTDYEGLAYMGEYPLSWAACCANESVYNLLIDHGADPDAQDSFGNMILHMVVVCDKLDMFGYALRHPKTPAKNGIVNDGGLTPLTLACKLGRAEVFREMLELSAREFWRYSNITCSGYPLNALDTLLPDGRTNWNSALFIILNGTKEAHLDMLDGGIIQRLLEEKWKTFAQNQFLKRLLILLVHLLCLSTSVYLRPAHDGDDDNDDDDDVGKGTTNDASNEDDEYNVRTIARYLAELCTISGVLSFLIFQQGDEIKNQGLSAFLKQLSHAPAKAIFLISNLLILACIPCRLMGDTDTEEAILIFAVPGSWFLLMFFAGAIRLTGPFVTMIYSMITGDMFTFGIIYSIVLCGFSQAFYFLYKGHPQLQSTMFNTYPSTWMALFQTTLGDYNYPDLNQTTYPNLSKTVFVMFMIFVPILLLNMLIAMMGNTYAHVIEQSEKEWMKQWAKIVVTLERAVPQADAKSYLEAYSIPLGPSDDSGFEVRGVMVIKCKSKTRAKQRKGAVSNWKRVGRVTLNALKKRNMTGEEMRRLMWGRASISSPVKIAKQKLKDPYNLNPIAPQSQTANITNAMDMLNFANEPASSAKQNLKATSELYQPVADHLRDLVLKADDPPEIHDPNFYNALKDLANKAFDFVKSTITTAETTVEATSLKDIKLTKQQEMEKPKDAAIDPTAIPLAGNLTTLFQDPKDMVDPKKLEQFLKLVAEVDTEESDGGGPILGKLSLARRTRTALFKAPIAKGDSGDKLIASVWDQVPTEDEDSIPNFDFQEALAEHILTVEQEPEVETETGNDDDTPETYDDDIPTVEEVHATMKQFHLRKRQYQQDDAARRAKSARIRRKNKVSPEYQDEDSEYNQRGRSAPMKKKRDEERMSPPDPLEPWSTRELQNINKILAKKAIRLTGPFVTMIYSMITGDMFTFGIIYSIVLCGFSQAFYFLYKGHPQLQSTMFNTYPSTWMALFQTTLGDYNYPDLNQTTYPNLSKTVFVMFMIFVPILLLNMLIAMMGNTYAHVIEQSEKEWMKQWAKIVVTLERAVPQADAKSYLEAYSIPLGPSDDSGFEVRGVMVIKCKSKTRAKQRKGAVSNWKRVGRVTLNALKKRNMTGEEMRRLMWGRASISSPVKIAKQKLKDPYNLNPIAPQSQTANITNAMDMLNFANEPASSAKQNLKATSELSQPVADHLRDLVLKADDPPEIHDPNFYNALKDLANKAFDFVKSTITTTETTLEATSLKDIKLTKQQEMEKPKDAAIDPTAIPLAGNLTTLFQDPKDMVDPKKLEQFLKLVAEVDTEESDGGGPILGKLSLARRTRTALFKAPIAKEDSKDKLIASVWDQVPAEDEDSIPNFDFQEALAEHILTVEQEPEVETETGNDDDTPETYDDDIPTVEEVHATMKQFHLRKRQYQQDDAARRAKSARIRRKNKVSPEYQDEDTEYNQRGRSAPMKKKRDEERMSPPDPLEPWSTRELQNINKILAKK